MMVMVVARGAAGVTSVISSDCIDHSKRDPSSKDSQHVEHYGSNVAAQGDSVESLGSVCLVGRVTQTVALNKVKEKSVVDDIRYH